ncbi:MAG: acyltransferase [Balneolales bacterium]
MTFIKNLFRPVFNAFIFKAAVLVSRFQKQVAMATLPRFANNPKNLSFALPREISHPERMHIGDNVKFGPGCMVKVTTRYPGSWMRHPDGEHIRQQFNPSLTIGNNVTATSNLHLAATSKITIEDNVMFASNVFLADFSHGYERGDLPYKYQGLTQIAPITIRRGSWIGQNVVILPGVTIGKNVIIGANSVVRNDIPEGCIAVGNPARIQKVWDPNTKSWKSVKKSGSLKGRLNA